MQLRSSHHRYSTHPPRRGATEAGSVKTRIGERVRVLGYPGIITAENERNVCVALGPALGVRWVLSKHAVKDDGRNASVGMDEARRAPASADDAVSANEGRLPRTSRDTGKRKGKVWRNAAIHAARDDSAVGD